MIINTASLEATSPMNSSKALWNTFRTRILNVNPLSANFTKWLNTLKQLVGNLPTICLSVFSHFMGVALKGLGSSLFYSVGTATKFFFEVISSAREHIKCTWLP